MKTFNQTVLLLLISIFTISCNSNDEKLEIEQKKENETTFIILRATPWSKHDVDIIGPGETPPYQSTSGCPATGGFCYTVWADYLYRITHRIMQVNDNGNNDEDQEYTFEEIAQNKFQGSLFNPNFNFYSSSKKLILSFDDDFNPSYEDIYNDLKSIEELRGKNIEELARLKTEHFFIPSIRMPEKVAAKILKSAPEEFKNKNIMLVEKYYKVKKSNRYPKGYIEIDFDFTN